MIYSIEHEVSSIYVCAVLIKSDIQTVVNHPFDLQKMLENILFNKSLFSKGIEMNQRDNSTMIYITVRANLLACSLFFLIFAFSFLFSI